MKSYQGPKTPDKNLFQLHEVPYASTEEGGALAMRALASKVQNEMHGTTLQFFYKINNLMPGNIFYVPLFRPTNNKPGPQLVPKHKKSPFPFYIPPILVPIIEDAPELIPLL